MPPTRAANAAPHPTLALLLALALAGCLGGGEAGADGPAPDPSPESPTPTTPAPPTSGGDGNATPTPAPTPDPQERAQEVVNATFDFSTGEAAGPEGKTATFEVPEGFATLALHVAIAKKEVGGQTPSLSLNQRVVVLDPEGNEALEASDVGASERAEVPATPGTWTIRYEGAANAEARVQGVATG